ncbi:MAG: signal recognition particle-docking protein FtsY [Chloroflexi bacterium]|jgi:fused signal recognition particle receptor|nr:signal recognition particle-docking protein FtsY [Chloroflexota bacterium]
MFWRRKPRDESDAVDESPVSDAEIEAQLEAELAASDAATIEAAVAGTAVEPDLLGAPRPWEADAEAGPEEEPEPIVDGDLSAGVARSRGGFMSRLRGILGLGDADAATWEEVEETLISGDVGATLAIEVVERARARRHPDGPEAAVRDELAGLLAPRAGGWAFEPAAPGGPAVVLVVGVNGTGKTTTIGKIAARERAAGRSVLLAAGDTFRAAAIDQLRLWGERAAAPVVAHAPGADPAAVVYDALDAAIARRVDVLIADTAGRLHTKSNLMDELAKMRRVIDRRLPGARPEVLFVLDATTGQNGLAQAKAFHDATGLTGIVLTKLDSTSKGGIVFAIEHALGVPVRFVGVGEKVGDLLVFDPEEFVAALFA